MAALENIYQAGWPVILAVAAVMALGWVYNRVWGAGDRDGRETALNIFIFIAGYGLQVVGINQIQNFALHRIGFVVPWRIPDNPGTWAAAYVAVDFVYYWRHRLEHTLKLLWAEHCVHHSSRELNLSTAGRLPWIMIATLWVAYIPLVMVGFRPEVLVACWSLNMGFQFIAHIAYEGKTPWMNLVFSTPSNHRVHHAENDGYLHRNFGGTFIIWDRLFGTYAAELEKVRIGCGHPRMGANPFRVNFLPMIWYLRGLFKDGGSLLRWAAESGAPTSLPGKSYPPQSP